MINIIYILKNKKNNKCYIGQTWKSLNTRWHNGAGYDRCIKMKNAIEKYGKENFYYEVLAYCEIQEKADLTEKFFINYFDTINNGYNIRSGGNNSKLSEETKKKISLARKGKGVGQKRSEESKKLMSEAKRGKKPYEMTDEIRQKFSTLNMGKGNPFYGKTHTNETRKKISDANKGRQPNSGSFQKGSSARRKEITSDIQFLICNDYVDGLSIRKIQSKYKIGSITLIRRILMENNIKLRPSKNVK